MDNSSISFSRAFALALIESDQEFPVDFDVAWEWLGYARKDNAKRRLESDFVEGIDYTLRINAERTDNGRGGGSVVSHKISLTLDCLKCLSMMAGTEKGKEVRQYFLQCESQLKRIHRQQEEAQRFLTIQDQLDIVERKVQILNTLPDDLTKTTRKILEGEIVACNNLRQLETLPDKLNPLQNSVQSFVDECLRPIPFDNSKGEDVIVEMELLHEQYKAYCREIRLHLGVRFHAKSLDIFKGQIRGILPDHYRPRIRGNQYIPSRYVWFEVIPGIFEDVVGPRTQEVIGIRCNYESLQRGQLSRFAEWASWSPIAS